jgi:ppGpp synthetase/RelA/SpoT-type nucleotidyltranferase
MTEIQTAYNKLLNQVSGKDWRKENKYNVGHAGLAIVVSFLHDRSLKLQELIKNIPDFSQTEIRQALKEIKSNGYFKKEKTGEYILNVDEDDSIESVVWWGLLINVAQGFIRRAK